MWLRVIYAHFKRAIVTGSVRRVGYASMHRFIVHKQRRLFSKPPVVPLDFLLLLLLLLLPLLLPSLPSVKGEPDACEIPVLPPLLFFLLLLLCVLPEPLETSFPFISAMQSLIRFLINFASHSFTTDHRSFLFHSLTSTNDNTRKSPDRVTNPFTISRSTFSNNVVYIRIYSYSSPKYTFPC